jgi:hypothetical protein
MKEYKVAGLVLFVAVVVAGIIFSVNVTKVVADEPLNASFPTLMQTCHNNFLQCNINAAEQYGQDLADCDAQFFNDPAAHQSCYQWANGRLHDSWDACDVAFIDCRDEMQDLFRMQRAAENNR